MENIQLGIEVPINALTNELESLKNHTHIKWSLESKENVEAYIAKKEKELEDLKAKSK